MNDARAKLWSHVDANRERYIALLRRLVQSSAGGEDSVQRQVAAILGDMGCQVEAVRQDPRPLALEDEFATDLAIEPGERLSVAGTLPGRGGGRSLMFFAHPDGEPVQGTEVWEHPLFGGDVERGRMYGWGVADDLLGIATMMAALEAVITAGVHLKGDVILASTASKRHARGVTALLERGYSADGAVYLHPAESEAGLGEIKAFTSGMLQFRLRVPGLAPDTSEPNHMPFSHLGVNPIDKAWIVYQALQALAERRAREVHHPLLHAAIGRSTNLQVSFIQCGDQANLERTSPECVLAGSLTFPPSERMADVQIQVSAAVQSAVEGDKWLSQHPPQLEWLMGVGAAEVRPEHPLYKTVSSAIAEVTGVEPQVYPLHAASDIRGPMLHSRIPTVAFGSLAGDLSQAGGRDEWVDLDDYVRTIKACSLISLDWCGIC